MEKWGNGRGGGGARSHTVTGLRLLYKMTVGMYSKVCRVQYIQVLTRREYGRFQSKSRNGSDPEVAPVHYLHGTL